MNQVSSQTSASQAADPLHLGAAGDTGAAMGAAGMTEFISFAIGDEQYGVDIMAVREIKEWSNVTSLPKQPEYVRGLVNLREVMAQIEGRRVGLIGDRVLDIVSFEASKVQPAPKIATGARNSFLSGLLMVEVAMIVPVDLGDLLSVQINADEDVPILATQRTARQNH